MINKILAIAIAATVLFVPGTSWAQSGVLTRDNALKATLDPCPRGLGTFHVEPVPVGDSLADLVYVSEVIVVGTVAHLLPATRTNPSDDALAQFIETHSVITVNQVLSGTLPQDASSIVLAQQGGHVPPCRMRVPDDPLVTANERYVLFLQSDDRTVPTNTTGLPRFIVAGVWSGKVGIVDGKVRFAQKANPRLQAYNNTGLAELIAEIGRLTALRIIPSPFFPPPIPATGPWKGVKPGGPGALPPGNQ
jgi:hypothetical protein